MKSQARPVAPRFSSRTGTLQRIDRIAGIPACGLLTIVRRIRDIFGSPAAGDPPRSILFIKLAEQGSTVLACDAIRAAVERVGRERVFFLVFEENRFILDALGLVPAENVLTIRTRSPGSMVASAVSRLAEIRRRRIDACVDMEFFARSSAAISYLTGARRRVGFHAYFREGPYRGDLLTHRVLYNPHLHTSRAFATLVRALELDPRALPAFAFTPEPPGALPRFAPREEDVLAVRRLLGELGVTPGSRLALLNANAGDLLPLRRWDGENYVALARGLLEKFPGLFVGFTGAPDEERAVAGLVQEVGSPRCVCLAGRTTLQQLLALYGLAEVLVTNDSGPAHFAALTAIDTVALFGPETPLLFSAPTPRHHAIWAGIACSPCVNALNNRQTACRDNVCMRSISVEQVLAAASEILRRRSGI